MLEKERKLNKVKIRRLNSYNNILNTNKNRIKNNEMNMASIISRIKYMQSKLKHSCNQLLDESIDKHNNYKTLITLSEEKNNNNKKKTIDKISPLAKRLLKKANCKINEVNQSALDIAKLNYLYYLNKPSNSIINKSCDEKSRNNKNTIQTSLDNNKKDKNNVNNINNISNNSFRNESDIIKKIRNKSLVKNFVYINNNYHKQLNSAFMKYNPTAHLNNMKILLQAVPNFHEDIAREKKEVENDIDFKNDKFKFKKKYLNYLNKQNLLSLNKAKVIIKPPKFTKNINKSVSLPKIRQKEEEKKEEKKINIPMVFINKLKKNKLEDFQKFKQNKISELNKLISISDNINNLIGESTIDNKIKKFINDYNLVKFKSEKNNLNDIKIQLNNIDYFKLEKSLIDEKLKSFYLKKYFNSIDKKEKNLFKNLNSELDIFTNKNIINRDVSLNELDSFLLKNDINIFEE